MLVHMLNLFLLPVILSTELIQGISIFVYPIVAQKTDTQMIKILMVPIELIINSILTSLKKNILAGGNPIKKKS